MRVDKEWLWKVYQTALSETSKRGLPYPPCSAMIITAHHVREQGWRPSKLVREFNVLFGIKATPRWIRKHLNDPNYFAVNAKTFEISHDGRVIRIRDYFRGYSSMALAVKDYLDLLYGLRRYEPLVEALEDCDYENYGYLLVKTGYSTGTEKTALKSKKAFKKIYERLAKLLEDKYA